MPESEYAYGTWLRVSPARTRQRVPATERGAENKMILELRESNMEKKHLFSGKDRKTCEGATQGTEEEHNQSLVTTREGIRYIKGGSGGMI